MFLQSSLVADEAIRNAYHLISSNAATRSSLCDEIGPAKAKARPDQGAKSKLGIALIEIFSKFYLYIT